ncbi:MAG: DNA polymerase III subunit delta' [Nitrospirota bacterium]
MAINDIIGQGKAIEMLSGILQRGKVATSYLFCGEPGIGKKTTAINFAKALNCQKDRNESGVMSDGIRHENSLHKTHYPSLNPSLIDACDKCDSCIKIDTGTHPDFLLISPEERQIRIEEIRMIDDALSFKPYEGRKKVVIVDDADTMNISASNAFLKTLEEPSEDSIIMLISSKPDRLPDTIRSRCSRINFAPLSLESCRDVIAGRFSGKDLDLIARLSMGRPGIALSGDLLEERTWFLNIFKAMLGAEKDSWSSREEMERWFELALIFFRDIAVLKITGEASKLINIDLYEYLGKLSKFADLKVIIYLNNELNKLKDFLMFNLNKSITWNFTSLLLRKELSI